MTDSCETIRLVVFDLAGTTIDHGCFGPVSSFLETLRRFDIEISVEEAREPMGMHKREHLRTLLQIPHATQQWQAKHGKDWAEEDIDTLFQQHFVPLQLEAISEHSELLPGLADTLAYLKSRDIKVCTTTGYFREAANLVYQRIHAQGFVPDNSLCADDVPQGRPAPWMIFGNMQAVDVYPPCSVVKVGDTIPDVAEGLSAGAWAIGVAATGSIVGLTAEQLQALPAQEQAERLNAATEILHGAGAHAVIDSVADLPDCIDQIEGCLCDGQLP